MRGTMIAVSDSPEGPFTLLKKDGPVTPPDFMTLDGTLYVDPAGKPWMVYAHEWIQKIDGTIEALPLKDDLSAAAGDPILSVQGLRCAVAQRAGRAQRPRRHYVTDGPELFRTKDGHLLMLWSSYEKNSFGRDGYVETRRALEIRRAQGAVGTAAAAGAQRQRPRHAVSHVRRAS
jgi:hypothetical protein